MNRHHFLGITWVLALFISSLATSAWAETRALLVGVSGYQNLPAEMKLSGPRNDVVLMANSLKKLGVSKVNILADGVTQSNKLPTHSNILQSIVSEINAARAGDWLIVYFSGHGSQQPQSKFHSSNNTETDGFDEIFLPIDAGRWDGRLERVSNALVDDEIGIVLSKAQAKGVSVWAIFDTCHAGDMMKALPKLDAPTQVLRGVSPAKLGVPRIGSHKKTKRLLTTGSRLNPSAQQANIVAFYASLADEPTGEESQLIGVTGVFTKHLTQSLDALSGETRFGDLMTSLQSQYRKEGRPFPTPNMDGNDKLLLPFVSLH